MCYWTTGLDGVVEGWVRKKGDASFTKVFSHAGGFPTLQWGGPNGVSAGSLSNYGTNDKMGAYRGTESESAQALARRVLPRHQL